MFTYTIHLINLPRRYFSRRVILVQCLEKRIVMTCGRSKQYYSEGIDRQSWGGGMLQRKRIKIDRNPQQDICIECLNYFRYYNDSRIFYYLDYRPEIKTYRILKSKVTDVGR